MPNLAAAPIASAVGHEEFFFALDRKLHEAEPELALPKVVPREPTFDLRIELDPAGRLAQLDVFDPALAPLQRDWTSALARHEPFPAPPAGVSSVAVGVRIAELTVVPQSLRLLPATDATATLLPAETALLGHQLEDLSDCVAPRRGAETRPRVISQIDDLTVEFAAAGGVARLDDLPAALPLLTCLDQHLRRLRLPSAPSARVFKLGLAVASGPPRARLSIAYGAVAMPAVKSLLRSEEGRLFSCYHDELPRDKNLAGRMKTRLTVDDTGAVALATVTDSTLHDEKVERCVVSALRKLRFPAAPKGHFFDFVHPILFRLEAAIPAPSAAVADTLESFENRWITMSSEHFIVYTEGGLPVAQRTLEEAERSYQALRRAVASNFAAPALTRPLAIVVISSASLYKSFAPANTSGIFRAALALGETDFVLLRGVGHFSVLQHELVHRLMNPVLPKAPPWLAEGLAQYYEWTQVDADSITVGSTRVTREGQRAVASSPYFPPVSTLIKASHREFLGLQAPGLYSATFWLTTTLNSDPRYRQRLARYIQALGRGLDAAAAWQETFGDADIAALERDYRAEPTRAEPVSYRLAWAPSLPTIAPARRLEFSEGHTLMARLYGAARKADARRALNQAIALDPHKAEAWARRALLAPTPDDEARSDAERATTLEPELPLGWVALGLWWSAQVTSADPIRMAEITRRLTGFADSADSQAVAALLCEARGANDAALLAARAAARLAPTSFYHQAVLSRLAARRSRAAESREARARATALAPAGLDPSMLERLLTPAASRPAARSGP